MFETSQELIEEWEPFIDNLDSLGFSNPIIEPVLSVDSDDYIYNDSVYAFSITPVVGLKTGSFYMRFNEDVLKIFFVTEKYEKLSIVFHGKAISDKRKLIDYLSVNIERFREICFRYFRLKKEFHKYNVGWGSTAIERLYISDIEREPPFHNLEDVIRMKEILDWEMPISFTVRPSIFSKKTRYDLGIPILFYTFINENLEFDLYYFYSKVPVKNRFQNLVKFPLTLDESVMPENRLKFEKIIRRIVK